MQHDELVELAAIEERHRYNSADYSDLWSLVNSIHKSPSLRSWVTLESVPLIPFISKSISRNAIMIHTLLAVPSQLHPWAFVTWEWPSRKLLAMIDITDTPQTLVTPTNQLIAKKISIDNIQRSLESGEPLDQLPTEYAQVYQDMLSRFFPDQSPWQYETRKAAPVNVSVTLPDRDTKPLSSAMVALRDALNEVGISKGVLHEWSKVNSRINEPRISVAVVGEFSRGKSTLINRLIDSSILPEGDLPTTAMVTKVKPGISDTLTWYKSDGTLTNMPVCPESWETLTVDIDGSDPNGMVDISCSSTWLTDSGLLLVDTPGAGDLIGERAARAIDAIATCDACLIVVSATMALSLTERAFAEEHVLTKGISKVAIVVTRLDQVPENERQSIVDYIISRVEQWHPELPVWFAHSTPVMPLGNEGFVAGIEAIREKLKQWSSEESMSIRNNRVVAQAKGLIGIARDCIATAKKGAELAEEDKRKAVSESREQLKKARFVWEDLQLEMEERADSCRFYIKDKLEEKKDEILEKLRYSLRHAQDPSAWWATDLPYLLKNEMNGVAKSLERSLGEKVIGDINWLDSALNKSMKERFRFSTDIDVRQRFDLLICPPSDTLNNLNDLRTKVRIGTGIMSILGYMVMAPLGIATAIGGSIITEKFMSGSIEKQRNKLSDELEVVMSGTIDAAVDTASSRIREVYATLLAEFKKKQELWIESQTNTLKQTVEGKSNTQYESLRALEEKLNRLEEVFSNLEVVVAV